MRPIVKGNLIVLFGSLGGGDKGKRPLQGEFAGKYADEVILTHEDDRVVEIADGEPWIHGGRCSGPNVRTGLTEEQEP